MSKAYTDFLPDTSVLWICTAQERCTRRWFWCKLGHNSQGTTFDKSLVCTAVLVIFMRATN